MHCSSAFIILSGGNGTRLWPMSRKAKPKQFIEFMDNETMFTQTIKRFKDKNGSIICRELLQGVETTSGTSPEPRTENYYKKRPCVELVGDSVEIFEQFLKESKSEVL